MGKRGKCVTCGKKFELKKKGFKRFSLKAHLGPSFDLDVATALSRIKPGLTSFPEDGHVCDSCFRLLRSTLRQREQLLKTEIEWENRFVNGPLGKPTSKTKSKSRGKAKKGAVRTGKRKLGEVQNIMTPDDDGRRKRLKLKLGPTVAVLCKNGGHENYMKKAIAYLLQYRYHKAITTIIEGSERAKKAFLGVLENKVRKEVYYFCKSAENYPQDSALPMESFSWKKECKRMESQLPTFYSACYAAMDIRKGTDLVNSTSASTPSRRLIRPRLGLMMMLPLYTRRERKFGFVMHVLSLLLRRYGNNEKMLKILHRLGICRPGSAALASKVDGMKGEESAKLLDWAANNLAEIRSGSGSSTDIKSSRRGKLPRATRPPADTNLSDDSDDDDPESDDENVLRNKEDYDDDDDDGNDDEDGDEDESDEDDDDDSSLLNMLSSSDDDVEEVEEEDDEWTEVNADDVEVEGCVEDIGGQDVEMVLMDTYKALKEGT